MADLQRIDPSVVPTPTESAPPTQLVNQLTRNAEQLQRAIPALTDQLYQVADAASADAGAKDAAKLIDPNGDGKVVAPASFRPPGWQFNSYANTYEQTARALYFTAAKSEFDTFRQTQETKFPTDSVALGTALKEKKDAMLSQMGAEYRPFMAVTFNSSVAQSISKAENNAELEKHQALVSTANREMAGFADEVGKSAGWQANIDKAGPGGISQETIDATFKLHELDWQQRIKPLLEKAGASPAAIADYQEKVKAKAIVAGGQAWMGRANLLYPPGHERAGMPNQEAIAQAEQFIRDVSKGKYAAEIRQGLSAGLAEASSIASHLGQAKRDQKDDEIMTQHRTTMQTVESMKQTDLPDSEQNAAIVNMLKKQRQDILFDPRFSAADTAKRLALNDQVLHTQTAANHEYYGGQIVQLAAQAHDAALTPSQRQQSADDLQAMVQDPNLAPVLSPALKAHAEQSLGQFHRAKAATEFHAVVADMAAGNVPIASYSDFVRDFGARGMISGDPGAVGTETQMAQAMAAGAKIQKERKQNQQMAADGYKAVQDGGVPSAEQAKAISAGQPFTVGGKPFNPMTPGHAEAMVASYRVNRVVDPTVKTAMEDLPFAGNADAAESVRKIYDGMRKVLRETVPAGQNIGIHATIQKQLGTDVADFGRLVSRTGDPLLAMKEWTNRSVSDSGSAGASTKDIAGRTNDAIDQWLNNPDTIGYLQSSLPGKWLYGKPTIAQQAMADMAGRGRSATTLGGFGGARYNRVEIEDGSIREEWNNHASGAVISNGGLAQSITGDRWRDAVETGQRMIADDLEIVDHPTKPGVGLLQRLGSETLTAKANGLDPTAVTRDDAWRYWGTIANSWRQINGGAAGPEVDPTTVRAESFRADDGTKMIRVTDRVGGTKSWYGGMTQGGQERVIFELPQDHPVMTLGRDLQYMAAQHIDQIIRPKPSPELEAMKPALSMAYAGYLAERALHFGEYAQVKTPGLNERFRKGLMFEELRAGTGSPSFFAHPEMLWTRMSNMPSAPTVAEWRSKLAAQSEAGRQARIRDQESLSISKFLTQGGELGAGMPMPRPDTRVAP